MSRKKKAQCLPSRPVRNLSPRELDVRNDELRTHYHFDSADLRANRVGHITDAQWVRLAQIRRGKRILLLVGLPIYLTGVLSISSIILWPFLIDGSCIPISMGLFGFYWFVYVVREIHYLGQLAHDKEMAQIEWVFGEAHLTESLFYWTKNVMVLDGIAFAITPKESGCLCALGMGGCGYRYTYPFHSGYWYTVYYLPHSKTILSAEITRDLDFEARLEQSVITLGADGEIEVG